MHKEQRHKNPANVGAQQDADTALREKVLASSVIMTTESQGGFEIAERIAIVSSQCAFGSRVFNDIFASVHDTDGGRTKAVEQTMQDGVEVVLYELKKQAYALQADAVVAITVQYTPIGYGSSNRTLVSGIGTAVRVKH